MGWSPIRNLKGAVEDVAKVVVGGVEKVADDVLGIDDSGGIVGSVKEIGDKIWGGLTEVGDELKEISENPYLQMAVAIAFPAYAPYVNAAVKLNSGEKLNAADIAAIAASAGQQDFADGLKLSKAEAANIKKFAKVATAKDPGTAFLTTFGADVAQDVGLTEAFDTSVSSTFGDDALAVLKQNENYIVDSARFASGNMSEQELVAKYGAGAIDYATSGTAVEDYNELLTDAVNVGFGVKSGEEIIADKYGEEIVNFLGAETTNERAVGLGGLTAATQIAMGKGPLEAGYAGTKRAYDEGARLEDLTFVTNNVAGLDFDLNNILPDLDVDFGDLSGRGYNLSALDNLDVNLPSLGGIGKVELLSEFDLGKIKDVGFDLNDLNLEAPDILTGDYSLPEVADLGLDLGKVNFEGYGTQDLGVRIGDLDDLGIDVGQLDINPELRALAGAMAKETVPGDLVSADGEVFASLEPDLNFLGDSDIPFSRQVLERTV